jgi:hypothetical protein
MRFGNPTSLQVGMSGILLEKTYRVAGRVVMGVEEGGETYFWNEFNLVAAEGTCTTLVYEETQSGGEWRLFTLFEPECELTAEDAATKQLGDPLNLDGSDVQVTLVDESRVYHIEGEAPEGVEVGDVARYFNAEAGDKMIVVSWTNNEVECYHGQDLSADTVNSAFNLRRPLANSLSGLLTPQDIGTASSGLSKWVLGFIAVVIAIVGYASCHSRSASRGPKKTSPPAALLSVGNTGTLDDRRLRVKSKALMEVACVGTKCEQHEYELVDQNGDEKALLVSRFSPGMDDWCLLTPLLVQNPLTPTRAATIQAGQNVKLDGQAAVVEELFQATVRRIEAPDSAHQSPGDVWYGFIARSGSTLFVARWNREAITYFCGKTFSSAEIKSAFSP